MLNVVLVLFLLFMIYWWGAQGIFSALIHLVLTIIAGVVAMALWEPLVYGVFINKLPESAWGLGLLVPFGVTLIVLRYVFDMTIPGNLDFHNMAQHLVGGFVGFVSGVLTFGLLLIGLQFSGISSVLGYEGYVLTDAGQPKRSSSLVVPVDTIASGFFSYLSGGSFSPIFSNTPLNRYHPDLALESSLYHQAAFVPSRRGLRPINVKLLTDGGFFQFKGDLPKTLTARMEVPPNKQLMIIGTDVALQPQGRHGAADIDATFRVARRQVSLVYDAGGAVNPHTTEACPVGYIQNGEFRMLNRQGAWTYSAPSVSNVVMYWVFELPGDAAPRFMRLKQTRLDLPAQPSGDIAAADALINYSGTIASGNTGIDIGPTNVLGAFVKVSDATPFVLNRNALNSNNVTTDGDSIVAGAAMLRRERHTPGTGLSVNKIHHTQNAKIVQIDLGQQKDPQSLLGHIMAVATSKTQAPLLVDATGRTYYAIGYGIVSSGGYTFSIDHNNTIRTLAQIDKLGSATGDDHLLLYYQLPQGISLVKFELGESRTQIIDPPLKVE